MALEMKMVTNISVRTLGKKVNRLVKDLGDTKKLNNMRVVRADKIVADIFKQAPRGTVAGTPAKGINWKPWKASYVRSLLSGKDKDPKHAKGGLQLQKSGDLRNNRIKVSDKKEGKIVFTATTKDGKSYATTHFYGSSKLGVPRRRFFLLPDEWGKEDNKVASEYYKQVKRKTGF